MKDFTIIDRNRRRDLLKLLILGMTSTIISNPLNAKEQSFKYNKVIIIGAGISGVAAAQKLQSQGYDVLIIEARDRIGGRIWSDESLGFPVDLGASWVQRSSGNPITKIAKKYNIKTVVDDDYWEFFESNGQIMSESSGKMFEESLEELEGLLEQLMYELDSDISIQKAIDLILANEKLSKQEKKYLDIFLASLESSSGADSNDKSLFYPESDSEFSGVDLLFPNGYVQIVKNLSRDLNIQLNSPVKKITQTKTKVLLTTESKEYSADKVIVTVPLGVLKSGDIQFEPELPSPKKIAISNLKMGLLNKIVMRFPSIFWPKEITKFGYIGENKGEFPAIINWYKISGQPVLMSFVSAKFARQLESLTNDEIIRKQMTVLKKIFGANIPKPDKVVMSRWASDSYAYGCYSYAAVGVTDKNYDALAKPVNNLFFAGEATNKKYSATVHGAYLSGLRAAKEIQN